jgi:GNAT superfamily N-acetyltransferase
MRLSNAENVKFNIRPYEKKDREAIRHICCQTGYLGENIDSFFSDREIFADFFTCYYLMREPENCFVAETLDGIVGYVTGCLKFRTYPFLQSYVIIKKIIPKVIKKLISEVYDAKDKRFIKWMALKAFFETPDKPLNCGHFHINIQKKWRNKGVSRALLASFFEHTKKKKIHSVCGQIRTFDNRRTPEIFKKLGFKFFNQKKISKYKDFYPYNVYISTFIKEF